MPQYMLLIYVPAGGPPPEAREFAPWFAYTQALQDAGVYVGENALELTERATTVRVRDGETVVSDGPFAETKEVLGGYYIVDVPDLQTAQRWAARIPSAPYGSVEVRPVMALPTAEEAGWSPAAAQG